METHIYTRVALLSSASFNNPLWSASGPDKASLDYWPFYFKQKFCFLSMKSYYVLGHLISTQNKMPYQSEIRHVYMTTPYHHIEKCSTWHRVIRDNSYPSLIIWLLHGTIYNNDIDLANLHINAYCSLCLPYMGISCCAWKQDTFSISYILPALTDNRSLVRFVKEK